MFEKNTIQRVQDAIHQRCTYPVQCALLGLAVAVAVQIAADLTCFYLEDEWHAVWRWRFAVSALVGTAIVCAKLIALRIRELEVLIEAFARMRVRKDRAHDEEQLLIDLKHHARFNTPDAKVFFVIPYSLVVGAMMLITVFTADAGCFALSMLYVITGGSVIAVLLQKVLIEIDLRKSETGLRYHEMSGIFSG